MDQGELGAYDAPCKNGCEACSNRRRAVTVRPPTEFLGNYVEYHFTRDYETHTETWMVIQDQGNDVTYLRERDLTFQDREGNWWWMWHFFHHTREQADKEFQEAVMMAHKTEVAMWQVIL